MGKWVRIDGENGRRYVNEKPDHNSGAPDWSPIDSLSVNLDRLYLAVIRHEEIAPGLVRRTAFLHFTFNSASSGATADITLENDLASRLIKALDERVDEACAP